MKILRFINMLIMVVVLVSCGYSPDYDYQEQYLGPVTTNYDALNNERYALIEENSFKIAMVDPVSTFSVDVDTASYSNVRRFIRTGQLPPKDAVRIEELINYFTYAYPVPEQNQPFSVTTEVATSPWNENNKLLQIGLQGRELEKAALPPSNLVFLIDVSGSMYSQLPLVKSARTLLIKQMRPEDRMAVVAYAGAAGLMVPSTSGDYKDDIVEALHNMQAGGGTNGSAGIHLAYHVAQENYITEGNNRVILATDGDFNLGTSSQSGLYRLIEEKRQGGVYLSVLGFGMGNLNDSTMELLADKGNGNYAYIDSLLEAKKVLVNEMGGTLFTIAKDVKIQVEFNPAKVESYRLIGYENRILNREDFNNDKKDAGEIGAGHTVTALYEIVPVQSGVQGEASEKYIQKTLSQQALQSNEVAIIKLRYKQPDAKTSQLITRPVMGSTNSINEASENLRFASAVAEFGMLLRKSQYQGTASYPNLIARANSATGLDKNGYRKEFVRLAETAEAMVD